MKYPYKFSKDVTPSNTTANILNANNEACTCRAVMVAVSGNISFLDGDGGTSVITNLIAGHVYEIATTRINSTGTTATGIKALW